MRSRPRRQDGDWNEQGWRRRLQEYALLLFLRKEPARSAQAHRRADRFHLRRMRRAVHGHHPRGEQILAGEVARRHSDPARNPQGARRLRHRPGSRQEGALGRGPQSLQAAQSSEQAQRRRTGEVEYPADRADRLGQDAARPDAGAHPRRAVHDGGCDDADRSRLCRRGRREHHPEAPAVRRLQRRAGAARHRLYRRNRQDFAQVRQPLDHPRRVGRGRAAGAAEDHGRNHCQRAAAGRPQASAAGIPAGRHHEYPVRLRRRILGSGKDHLGTRPLHVDRFRRQGVGAGGSQAGRDFPRGRARGFVEVRPHSGIRRPASGRRDAGGSRRAFAQAHPHRAEERAGQAVSAHVRDGDGGSHAGRRGAFRDRPQGDRPQDRRARVALDHGEYPARHHVRPAEPRRRRGGRDLARGRRGQRPAALHLCRPFGSRRAMPAARAPEW